MSHLYAPDFAGRLMRLVILAVLFALVPLRMEFLTCGLIDITVAEAHAKGGDDDDDDDDNSGSGSGGDDDDDDNSGSGSGSDDDDDGGDDSSGSGSGDDDNSGPDDDDDDDDGYSGSNDGRKLEVRLADGTRIEIDDGILERRDASGRVVERRRATQRDYSLFKQAGISSGGAKAAHGKVAQIRLRGDDIEVIYQNGWREAIRSGRYVLTDPLDRTVIQRRARQSDYLRLNTLAGK